MKEGRKGERKEGRKEKKERLGGKVRAVGDVFSRVMLSPLSHPRQVERHFQVFWDPKEYVDLTVFG